MAKRFTDTDKWKKPFIRGLDAQYKLLWFYILDDCDHAGIWIVDLEIAGLRCGFTYEEEDVKTILSKQIEILNGGDSWFIRDFVDFQYGTLNEGNRAHNSVIKILNKHKIKPLTSPLQGGKDKDKELDKDKDKESFDKFWNLYDKKQGTEAVRKKWGSISQTDKALIFEHIPKYVAATPDKKFRKLPLSYLNQQTWLDEELPTSEATIKPYERFIPKPPII